jgi:hypothetical protein
MLGFINNKPPGSKGGFSLVVGTALVLTSLLFVRSMSGTPDDYDLNNREIVGHFEPSRDVLPDASKVRRRNRKLLVCLNNFSKKGGKPVSPFWKKVGEAANPVVAMRSAFRKAVSSSYREPEHIAATVVISTPQTCKQIQPFYAGYYCLTSKKEGTDYGAVYLNGRRKGTVQNKLLKEGAYDVFCRSKKGAKSFY